MCQQLRLLAKCTDWQWIAQGERGILYLTWNRVTVRMHLEECSRLAAFLETWKPEEHTGLTLMREDGFRLFQDPSGRIQFWLYDTGLQLTTYDMPVLRKLVQTALQQRWDDDQTATEARSERTLRECSELHPVSRDMFSPN